MRVVAFRVKEASVLVDHHPIASIQKGMVLLVGFCQEDDESKLLPMAKKIVSSRIFSDESGKTNWNICQSHGEILSVSQFTLYANVKEGNRPSFTNALSFDKANALYQKWLQVLESVSGMPIPSGQFGADMDVCFVGDGPFTICFDSKELGI